MASFKYPSAKLDPNMPQNDILTYAQGIHNGIAANPGLYPVLDLPVSLTALQNAIDDYQAALATAVKGTKNETALKEQQKNRIISILRVLQQYVTNVARGNNISSPSFVPQIEANILASGFFVNKTASPAMAQPGLAVPIVRKAYSRDPGTFYLVIRNYTAGKRGKKLFQLNYRTAAHGVTPAGEWTTYVFSGGNANINGLISGTTYDWQVAAIGGRNVKTNGVKPVNFTKINQVVIV